MARVYFRYSKGVRAELAAKYGEPMAKVIKRLKSREDAGEKIVWPRQVAPKNGTWWLDYRNAANERTYDSTTATTQGEAEKKLREKLQAADDIRSGRAPVAGRAMRIREACAELLRSKKGRPAYVTDEVYIRLHIIPALGAKFLSEVTATDVDAFASEMLGKGYSPGTVKEAVKRIKAVYTWARKARVYVGISPVEDAEKVVVPKRAPRSFTESQLDRFLSAAGPWTLMFQVAGILGPRKGEVCGLQWADFVEEFEYPDGVVGPVLHIRRSYDKPYPKGKKERLVPVPDDIAAALVEARKAATTRWMFPSSRGRMRTRAFNPAVYFRRCCVRAGIVRAWGVSCPCGFSDELPERKTIQCPRCAALLVPRGIPPDMTFRHLRSTAATRVGDIRKAQSMLGHADLATTAGHYHATEIEGLRDALQSRATSRVLRSRARDKSGTSGAATSPDGAELSRKTT